MVGKEGGDMSIKLTVVLFAALAFALDANAIIGTGSVSGRVRGHKSDKTLVGEGGASELKAKNAAEKQTRAKAKEITIEKLEFPKGAKHSSLPIDVSSRIDSLCGYEIGSIAKVSRHPQLDKDGNIVVTEKLKTPFRKCTQVELKYSKVNHALYYIRVFAPAQKKVTDEAALSEVEAMSGALKTKFDKKIGGFTKLDLPSSKSCRASMQAYSFQTLEVHGYKDNIEKRGVLKGTADARPELGWAFSVILTDSAMQNFVPETSAPANDVSQKDVDAL